MSGIDVTSEIEIARPRHEVARFLEDPANDLHWIRALTQPSRIVGDGPFGEGAVVRRVARMPGRTLTYDLRVTRYEPGRLLDMEPAGSGMPMFVSYQLSDAGAGTRVRVRNRGGRGPLFAVAAPLIGRFVKSRVDGDLRQLKRVLEAVES